MINDISIDVIQGTLVGIIALLIIMFVLLFVVRQRKNSIKKVTKLDNYDTNLDNHSRPADSLIIKANDELVRFTPFHQPEK